MELNLCKIDWVAISAIVTFLMAIAAFWALYENRKQLNELKRQWQEEHKARLEFDIEIQRHMFCLKMQNIGKSVAEIKKIEINEEFLEKMPDNREYLYDREHLKTALRSNSLRIASGATKYYPLCMAYIENVPYSLRNEYPTLISTPIKITYTLADNSVHKYEFKINDYLYLGEALTIESDVAIALNKIESLFRKHIKNS